MNGLEVICMGTGEIGRPIYELLSGVYDTLPLDPLHYPNNRPEHCDYLHVCIPGDLQNFDDLIMEVCLEVSPKYIIIHSTVVPGTIDKLQDDFDMPIIHAPVQGKHGNNQMKKDMLRYPKYIGVPETITETQKSELITHFEAVGFSNIKIVEGVRNVEWQKVLATSLFGWQIVWAQEVERICDQFDLDFNLVADIYNYIEDIIPPHYPGVIGGHCVMPNIDLIGQVYKSIAFEFIKESNKLKRLREK